MELFTFTPELEQEFLRHKEDANVFLNELLSLKLSTAQTKFKELKLFAQKMVWDKINHLKHDPEFPFLPLQLAFGLLHLPEELQYRLISEDFTDQYKGASNLPKLIKKATIQDLFLNITEKIVILKDYRTGGWDTYEGYTLTVQEVLQLTSDQKNLIQNNLQGLIFSKNQLSIFNSLPLEIKDKIQPYLCFISGNGGPDRDNRIAYSKRRKISVFNFCEHTIKKVVIPNAKYILSIVGLFFYFKYSVNPVWDDISNLIQERNNRLMSSVAETNRVLDIVERSNFIKHTGPLIRPTFAGEYYGNYSELLRRLVPLLPLSFILPGIRTYSDYASINNIYQILCCAIFLGPINFIFAAFLSPIIYTITTNNTLNFAVFLGVITVCVASSIQDLMCWEFKVINPNKESLSDLLNDPTIEIADF
ncbi:MAG TPA: hypothetical protein VLB80_02940 [Candidatus Babeliales bacterium]|nr:hypothetical protein [Candidatus Babeliales bacterium]